jgi:acyl-CoA synthetase (AMP-forming)/AMP-acid ligase II/1-acyl-sn-glycerol-3-phosphate acyltransferase/acyl carrier protein
MVVMAMLKRTLRALLAWAGRRIFSLRYRADVRGLDEIRRRGTRSVIFLPSHSALVDPALLMVEIDPGFQPRALADEYQITRPVVGPLARLFGARPLPNMERQGLSVMEATRRALDDTIAGVRAGENLLFYPSGRLRQQHLEEIRAASGTEILAKALPEARFVLVRITGLWGSSYSLGFTGQMPSIAAMTWRGLKYLLLNGIFFMPRRRVLIEFEEPRDFPRHESRMAINAYLEAFYNARAPRNTYVPYAFWETGGVQERPDPEVHRPSGDAAQVPEATRRIVFEELSRLTGRRQMALSDRLAQDLGVDSLAAAELVLWIEKEFGFPAGTPESLVTVGDVVLAASGKGISAIESALKGMSPAWRAVGGNERIAVPPGDSINEAFLAQAARRPGQVILADQVSGEVTYRRLVLGLLLMAPTIRELPGRYVGIMLPASVGAGLFYLAALFAGKTPVMVNWTTGSRNLVHALDLLGVERVITARALLSKLETMGVDLSALSGRFVLAEDLRARFSPLQKIAALVRSRLSWSPLRRAAPTREAVVLFTSGSESLPKAVPLTHANILTNVRDTLAAVRLEDRDVLIGMLPPFHSFGITVTTILPLCSGLRTVYHPNPTEAAVLARVVAAFRVTLLVGTPTFLNGIVRAAQPGQLDSLRFAVTGAEKCPPVVYEALRRACPDAAILEGYGITECSPIVSANRPERSAPGSIGKPLDSVEWAVVDLERGEAVRDGDTGMLLVRGPSIFSGYLNYDGESPFVDWHGKSWYRTGDLVRHDGTGWLYFEGRLKRFVKLGGEMISLPAIEAVLQPHFATPEDEGPPLAVETLGPTDSPEIVLFSVRPTDRERVNRLIREAGLSALHHVREVIQVAAIPVLGTGKTDYRGLKDAYLAGVGKVGNRATE